MSPSPGPPGSVPAPALARGRSRRRPAARSEPIDVDAPAGPLHRQLEPRLVDRLQQVVDRVDLERLDGVLIVRRDEDDVRPVLRVEHPPRHLEPGQPGHLHVEKHDVGLQAIDGRERLDPVARLPDHLDAPHLPEEVAQFVPRQLFVVHQHGAQVHLTP